MTITLQSGYGGIHVSPAGWVAANDGAFPQKTSPQNFAPHGDGPSLRRHAHQQQRSNLLTNLRASTADIHGNLGVMTRGL